MIQLPAKAGKGSHDTKTKQIILFLFLITIFLVSGCTKNSDAKEVAKTNPTINEFLIAYPNAVSTLTIMPQAKLETDNDFIEQCDVESAEYYYKVIFTTESSDSRAVAFGNKNHEIACVFTEAAGNKLCIENWSCSEWDPIECPIIRTQIRTCTDLHNCDTSKSKPSETQNCVYGTTPECEENWSCTEWSECIMNTQTRSCVDASECNTTDNKPSITQQCNTGCTENWSCTEWSICMNGMQVKTCTDLNDCGTENTKPAESKSCTECIDSDYGQAISVKGIVTMGSQSLSDHCNPNGTITEYFCESIESFSSLTMECPVGQTCENGACVEEPAMECTDTDGGINYYEKGIATNDLGSSTDQCNAGLNAVTEGYCDEEGNIKYTIKKCSDLSHTLVCSDGACVEATIECTTDADCGEQQSYNYCVENAGFYYMYQHTTGYSCSNPGWPSSNCSEWEGNQQVDYCPNGCENGACI